MHHQLTIHSDLSELPGVFTWLDERLGESSPACHDFKVICDELLSNIIHYGLDDDQSCVIELSIIILKEEIRLSIVDQARPFNPLASGSPDLDTPVDERNIGGLGIALTCSLTDDQHYRYENGCNYLTLVKRVS